MTNIFEYKDCLTSVAQIPSINIYNTDKIDSHFPKFTIAIPTYKRVSTLSETIESALLQEDFENYEIIIVDNNPERGDETEIFMQKYRNNPQITYYKNSENIGMAGNWNKCILLSNSSNIVLLHDDDLLSPFALSTFNQIISKLHDYILIKPNTIFFSEGPIRFSRQKNMKLIKLHPISFGIKCAVGAPSVILYNKQNFLATGGFNQEYFPCLDYVNNFICTFYGNSYITKECVLGGYRIGCNESLNQSTMDMYFRNNQEISSQILKHYIRIKKLIGMFQSAFWNDHYNATINQYHMHDYSFEKSKIGLTTLPVIIQKVLCFAYRHVVSLCNRYINI